VSKPSGVLVPLTPTQRDALPEAVREHARGWQAPQAFAARGLVTPAGVAERELAANGWSSRGRIDSAALPPCLGCAADGLQAGARVWAAHPAAAAASEGWPRPGAREALLEQVEADARALLVRALRQLDLVAVGDLLQTTRVDTQPARTLARVAALQAASASGAAQLAALLRADADAGVTPLALAALGAASWEPWRGPWPLDSELEAGLAQALLAGPQAPAGEAPAAVRELQAALAGAHAPPAWLPSTYAAVHAALNSAPGVEALPTLPGDGLGFVLADQGSPAPVRRARLRRATPPLACQRWFPELAPLDVLVADALEHEHWAPVRSRLTELQADLEQWTAAEVERARALLDGATARSAAAEAALLALRAAAGEDVLQAARALLERGDAETEPLAFEVLEREGADPGPLDPTDPIALAQLCRFHAWRGARGHQPSQALLDALLAREIEGLRLSEAAAASDLGSVAQALATALPDDLALDLVAPLAEGTLLVRLRPDGAWDAIVSGEAVVLRRLDDLELPEACLATPPGLGETPFAESLVPTLGRVAVCHRVRGLPVGPSAPAWRAVVGALQALHRAGFALGSDPLLALRRTTSGWAFRGLDLRASLCDPEPAQRADVTRLLERARVAFADPPRSLGELAARLEAGPVPGPRLPLWRELRDYALDRFASADDFSLDALCGEFEPAVTPECAREVVLSLDAELWASGAGQLVRTDGGFAFVGVLTEAAAGG